MNTDKLIPISYVKQFTPLVKGDVVMSKSGKEYVVNSPKTWLIGMAEDWYLVSFADRPNTGKQPKIDLFVNVYTGVNSPKPANASDFQYWWTDGTIKLWKPNYDALLAKFKEQGANTMFTFENTKEATHAAFYPQFRHVALVNKDSRKIWHPDEDGWRESLFMWEDSGQKFIELSRPPGERKEDHTIDGLTTYALAPVRQYDDQEAELATHYSGNNNRFYIQGHTMIRKAMVLNDDGRWIYSDCTTNAELDGDEFWKLDYYGSDQIIEPVTVPEFPSDFYQSDNSQVIETWVGDHITEQKESAGPGVDFDDALKEFDLSVAKDEKEPVFTQEMADNNEMPPIGYECEIKLKPNMQSTWEVGCIRVIKGNWVCIDRCDSLGVYSIVELLFRPIDNRTPDEKIRDHILSILEMPPGVNSIIDNLLHSDKFTITLKD